MSQIVSDLRIQKILSHFEFLQAKLNENLKNEELIPFINKTKYIKSYRLQNYLHLSFTISSFLIGIESIKSNNLKKILSSRL